MKKIIGILLAGAMAFSAFAADVSAKVQLEGELLNITDGAVNALNINKPSDQHWNPIMNFAVNGDQAGAEFAVSQEVLKVLVVGTKVLVYTLTALKFG